MSSHNFITGVNSMVPAHMSVATSRGQQYAVKSTKPKKKKNACDVNVKATLKTMAEAE